ncbi:hypothetical protein D3C87_2093670 [compost metagenome]
MPGKGTVRLAFGNIRRAAGFEENHYIFFHAVFIRAELFGERRIVDGVIGLRISEVWEDN